MADSGWCAAKPVLLRLLKKQTVALMPEGIAGGPDAAAIMSYACIVIQFDIAAPAQASSWARL